MNDEKTILIVDDYNDDVVFLKHVMKKAGVVNPVMQVNTGEEAMHYFKGEGVFADRENFPLPSILFIDLKMPSVDGFELLDWLQQQPHLRSMLVIVVTGDWERRGVTRAYRMGAQSFLVKPCNAVDILNLTQTFPGPWMISPPPDPNQDSV
ncbi:MAG: response regulator receiver protein [Pedosphaera sp.]|nr:response regulator receiver protein [Pedosphaera sp.]